MMPAGSPLSKGLKEGQLTWEAAAQGDVQEQGASMPAKRGRGRPRANKPGAVPPSKAWAWQPMHGIALHW